MDDAHVQVVRREPVELLRRGQLVQLQLQSGVTLPEVREQGGHGLTGEVRGSAARSSPVSPSRTRRAAARNDSVRDSTSRASASSSVPASVIRT